MGLMARWLLSLVVSSFLITLSLAEDLPLTSHPDTSDWKSLFEADLSNAIFEPQGWTLENDVLQARDHGTIWTRESYGDFILDLEFKVGKDANSGVFLRTGDINDVLTAIEVQIHETTDGTPKGMVGAIYDVQAPSQDVSRPAGEWNRYTITCKGSLINVVFNGTQVINMDLNDWTEPHKNPDGTRNKFSTALKDYAREGPIGFQGIHGEAGQPVFFRNLKIKVLE